MKKRVTFGFINCNRLFYLKSCVESLLKCTSGYPEREFIIVDNASIEPGTAEYLDEKEKDGFNIVRRMSRDPHNEFAIGLNIIASKSTGDFVCPLQGDMQFVQSGGWLDEYVDFYARNVDDVGCMIFDAQRRARITNHRYVPCDVPGFLFDLNRNPVCGAGDVMYSRKIIDMIFPWNENNAAHEGGQDSETAMLTKVRQIIESQGRTLRCVVPIVSPAVAICTDMRGTNARVRGNRRYGDYWPAKNDEHLYYEIGSFEKTKQSFRERSTPVSIEELARPIGWDAPLDATGNWKKNPIRPESASNSDFVELVKNEVQETDHVIGKNVDPYLDDWMNS